VRGLLNLPVQATRIYQELGICSYRPFQFAVSAAEPSEMHQVAENMGQTYDALWGMCLFDLSTSIAHGTRIDKSSLETNKILDVCHHL
jgi:hypothetical protein